MSVRVLEVLECPVSASAAISGRTGKSLTSSRLRNPDGRDEQRRAARAVHPTVAWGHTRGRGRQARNSAGHTAEKYAVFRAQFTGCNRSDRRTLALPREIGAHG